MQAGYSGTSLVQKLGIKQGQIISVIDPPPNIADLLAGLPEGATLTGYREAEIPAGVVESTDVLILFATRLADLVAAGSEIAPRISSEAALWVSWPKRSSGISSDISEDSLRATFLPGGLVDNKVCAVDETWSGLRFVVRRELRTDWPAAWLASVETGTG